MRDGREEGALEAIALPRDGRRLLLFNQALLFERDRRSVDKRLQEVFAIGITRRVRLVDELEDADHWCADA
jgi:hypothetical protein